MPYQPSKRSGTSLLASLVLAAALVIPASAAADTPDNSSGVYHSGGSAPAVNPADLGGPAGHAGGRRI